MVIGGDSCSKVAGSNPGTVYWMHIFQHIPIRCEKCNNVCLKRPKINNKRGRGWPILKKNVCRIGRCMQSCGTEKKLEKLTSIVSGVCLSTNFFSCFFVLCVPTNIHIHRYN